MALAHFVKGEFESSLDLANRALALSEDPKAHALCFELISLCHSNLKQYALARDAALSGLRLDPKSKELAALRIACAHSAGDGLDERMGQEYLAQIDPDYARKPTLFGVDDAVIIMGIVGITIVSLAGMAVYESQTGHDEVALKLAEAVSILCETGRLDHLIK